MRKHTFIRHHLPKLLSAAMSVAILCGIVGTTAYSAGAENTVTSSVGAKSDESKMLSKEETVYVIADAKGAPQKIIVSNWIKNPDKADTITDSSDLTDIENVKGDETYTINEKKQLEWKADGNDIYYRGTSAQKLPVGVSIQYFLDGAAVAPDALVGKSGKVKMVFTYDNRQFEEAEINGKKEKIYVPFIMMTGMMLDNTKFSNVTVSNGKVINDGTHTYVAGFALPGMQDSLGVKKSDWELPSTVEVTADVTDFSLSTTLTVATDDLFADIDTAKADKKVDELKDKLRELTDGVEQLADGSSQLYTGLGTLLSKSDELVAGVNRLYDGAAQLEDGASALDSGAGDLKNGAEQLDAGLGAVKSGAGDLNDGAGSLSDGAYAVDNGAAQLQGYIASLSNGLSTISANSGQLVGGAEQVFDTLLSTADTQIAAAGLSAPSLTIENYNAVLDGLIGQLSEDAVRRLATETAQNTVSATVNSQREVIRQAVEAEVKKQVTNGVLAAAGLPLTADNYEAAAAAGQIPEDVFQQICGGIAAQMAGMSDTVDAQTEAQIASLIETNMQSDEVQAQIEEAVAKASSGKQSLQALKAQLDSYNAFYQGIIGYTNGVDEASSGARQLMGGAVTLRDGTRQLAGGAEQLKEGTGTLKDGTEQLADGSSQLKDGTVTLKDGTVQLHDGAHQLFSGIASLREGTGALIDGVSQLHDGGMQLSEGMQKLQKEGVDKITDAVDGDLSSLTQRFKAMVQAAKNYRTFSGKTDSMDGKVNFIFKTDSIEEK
ncbi:MAG: hypothetical protein IJ598_08395 [Ruminococcus sp.]|nr:hypothetical protein [Ruminococcus sp.]